MYGSSTRKWVTNVALLQDLAVTSKIRCNDVQPGVELKQGQELIITTRQLMGNNEIVALHMKDCLAM